jgi:hypothetical protein
MPSDDVQEFQHLKTTPRATVLKPVDEPLYAVDGR